MANNVADILYQADENYAFVLAVSLRSFFENNKDVLFNTVIIDCGMSPESREKLSNMALSLGRRISFLNGDELAGKYFGKGFGANVTYRANKKSYYKIMYPCLEMAAERILYIDCDTVVSGSVKPLLEMPLEGKIMAAAYDSNTDAVIKRKLGISSGEPYYNSGVMVINKKEWNRHRVFERILKYNEKGLKFNTVDQTYINLAVKGKAVLLDCRYNLQPWHRVFKAEDYLSVYRKHDSYYSKEELEAAKASPVIIHFFRYLDRHPWDNDSMHPNERLFRKWLKLTPWADMEPKKKEIGFFIKIERMLYRILPGKLFLIFFRLTKMAYNVFWKIKRMIFGDSNGK